MKFLDWLKTQTSRDDAIGDFARDAISDPNFPKQDNSWFTFEGYLDDKRACEPAKNAGFEAWFEFNREVRKIIV